VDLYSEAVRKLPDTASETKFFKLYGEAENARLKAEQARRAVEKHTNEHGCSGL